MSGGSPGAHRPPRRPRHCPEGTWPRRRSGLRTTPTRQPFLQASAFRGSAQESRSPARCAALRCNMAFYRSVGEIPPKRHTQFRQPDGTLYAEELMGEEGFSSDSSLLYHRGIPSATSDSRVWDLADRSTAPNHPLRPLHLWLPEGTVKAYVIEANSHITPPRRYLSKFGQLLEHSPYCERDLHGPSSPLLVEGSDVEVYTLHRGNGPSGQTGSIVVATTHPFDVVGWDGCLYPYTFNVDDFEPITGRVHQPPPVHQVFEGTNFVICNFVPRKVDYHPLAIPVPYYHSNVDSDEVMFYCGGDYEARKGSGVALGSISLHPGGHSHGPQPGAAEAAIGKQYFDELAVMIDTFRPLELGEGGQASDDGAYALSWNTALRG